MSANGNGTGRRGRPPKNGWPLPPKLEADCRRELERLDAAIAELVAEREATAVLHKAVTGTTTPKPQTKRRNGNGGRKHDRGIKLLGVVRAHPGITAREAGVRAGMPKGSSYPYTLARRLEESGHLRREDAALYPVAPSNL